MDPWVSREARFAAPSRRAVLRGTAAVVLLGGCSAPDLVGEEASPTPPAPVDVPPYTVLPGEVEPGCKIAAVRAVEAALTWRGGASSLTAGQERVTALGLSPDALTTVAPLYDNGAWSSVEITYPQYSGLLPDMMSAGVMVVANQLVPGPVDATRQSITLDVRLTREADVWTTEQIILPATPSEATPPGAAVTALLAEERVRIPAAGQADLLAGTTHEPVARMLTELAIRWRLDVHVLRTGHPDNVFGSDRLSNHTRGRAVDIWAIDDVPVIDQSRAEWEAVMRAAAELGADEIGGPRDVDGVRGRPYFTDAVHQDHLHLGFEPA